MAGGIFPAAAEYDQQKKGTTPVSFEKDKEELLKFLMGSGLTKWSCLHILLSEN
jgi:hypothetical protein